MKRKIVYLFLAVLIVVSCLAPFNAFASAVNTIQTAESIALGQSATYTFKYGYPNGDYKTSIWESSKHYKFVAPDTKYYEFQLTGFENCVYSGTLTPSCYFYVTDASGKTVGGEWVNEYTYVCKEAYQLTKGQTYYIEVNSDASALASYRDYDYGYATQTLKLAIRNHTHSMKVSSQGIYSTYYTCEYCDYSYSKENVCKHSHTKKTVIKSATYWATGIYNLYCTDCGKNIKTEVKINKKKVAVKSVKAGKKKATVNWKKVSGATGYKIKYSTNSNMKGAKTIKVKSGSTVSKTIKGLKKGKKYYFRVVAVKGKKTSSWSSTKSVKVK